VTFLENNMNEVEQQAKIEEARAAGYTDEQIQAYLNPQAPEAATKETPWVERGAEKAGTLQAGAVEAAKLGGEAVAGGLVLNKLGQMFGRGQAPATPAAPVEPPIEAPRVQVPQNAGGGPRPQITPQQTMEALGRNYGPAQQAVKPAAPEMGARPMPQGAPAPTQAPPVSPAAAQGETFIQRMSTLAKQYGPTAARIGTGVGAMLYSPELNAGEDQWVAEQRRRQGRR